MSAGEVSLQTLVALCLKRRVTAQVFNSLFKQLNHKSEVGVQDLVAVLSAPDEFDPLVVMYLTSVSTGDQSTNLRLSTSLDNLISATDSNQYLLLNALTNTLRDEHYRKQFPFNSFEISAILTSLSNYVKNILDRHSKNHQILESISYFLNVFFEIIPFEISPLSPEQNELLTIIIGEIKQHGNTQLADVLEANINKSLKRSSIGRQSISISAANPSTAAASHTHTSHLSFLKTNKLPKFIWLNSVIQNWSSNSDKFLPAFGQFVKVKTNQNILNELINTSFECITIALQSRDSSDIFLKNWKLFFTKRLPLLIRSLNLKNVESSLSNALNLIDPKISKSIKLNSGGSNEDQNDDDMFSSFPSTNTDIRHDFLRSCIALKLLPSSAFNTILKEDAHAENRSLVTNDDAIDQDGKIVDIDQTLHSTLIDINPEFIPLEDSGLLEFLNAVEGFEGTKQFELSQLILKTINDFIANDDVSHFYRLALGLGLSEQALHAILFHLSPKVFLKPIMNFLDKWQSSNDDMNFQDLYSSFGCVLLLFLLIVKKYNVSLEQLLLLKDSPSENSFCIKYLVSLGSLRQIENNDEQSELLNGWINALFDSGGISDDLMRLSTVQECFQLFPVIFQQAFIGCKQGIVDIDTVKGGLEYFLQPFLLSTIVGILSWSENYLWKNQDVDLLVSLIKNLINPMDLSGDSVHIHKFVMSIYGPNLLEVLTNLDKNSNSIIDPSLLSSLRGMINPEKSTNFFEYDTSPTFHKYLKNGISDSSKKIETQSSPLMLFHNQFHTLLNWSQSSIVSNYDFQLFSTLSKIIGEETLLDYFLGQFFELHSTNSKSSQTVLELSTFLITIQYIDSSKTKNDALNSLKNGNLIDCAFDTIKSSNKFFKVLLEKKQNLEQQEQSIEKEILQVFYDKFIESVQAIIPLNE